MQGLPLVGLLEHLRVQAYQCDDSICSAAATAGWPQWATGNGAPMSAVLEAFLSSPLSIYAFQHRQTWYVPQITICNILGRTVTRARSAFTVFCVAGDTSGPFTKHALLACKQISRQTHRNTPS